MRRGFREESKRLALEVRAEIGLDGFAPLDPRLVAEAYGIPIYPLDELEAHGCPPDAIVHFVGERRATFSAALVPVGSARFMIENSIHSLTRRTASIAHELAHLLLEHEFQGVILTVDGCRSVDKEIEAEADCLGGELLITYRAALRAARTGMSDEAVAYRYGVSPAFAAMRMNASGARLVASRQRNAYRRRLSGTRT